MQALSILAGLGLLLCSCGSGGQQTDVQEPTVGSDAGSNGSTDKVKSGGSVDLSVKLGKIKPKVPPGVKPFPSSAFVRYLGFAHGASKSQVANILPKKHSTLGKRSEINLVGSTGFEYSGHLAISWDSKKGSIDYLSVRSDAGKRYMEAKSRSDSKLDALWGASPSAVWGILGKPSDRVSRPHLEAFMYKFRGADKQTGTLTLKFSKLSDPPRCQSVSVAWDY